MCSNIVAQGATCGDINTSYTGAVHFGVYLAIWLVTGFIIGSIPFAWIVARAKGVNLRAVGSGNVGATNLARALGWRWGLPVLLLDALKGFLSIIALQACLAQHPPGYVPAGWYAPLVILVGLAAILGHTYSPWLRFKGGKGVAAGLGVLVALMQFWVVAPLAAFALIVGTTRYISVGSIFAGLVAAATIATVPSLRQYWPFGVVGCLFVLWTHRENMNRLWAGTENRLGSQKPAATNAPDEDGGADEGGR